MSEAPAGTPRAGFALLFSLSMAQLMVVLDFTIVNVTLPSIQDGLFITAGFALAGLLATRVVPPAPPHPHTPQRQPEPHHLFHHHAGGIP